MNAGHFWRAGASTRNDCICTSNPNLFLGCTKISKRYSLGEAPKSAANAVEWRRVLSLARSAHIARQRVKRRVILTHAGYGRLAPAHSPFNTVLYAHTFCSPGLRPSARSEGVCRHLFWHYRPRGGLLAIPNYASPKYRKSIFLKRLRSKDMP